MIAAGMVHPPTARLSFIALRGFLLRGFWKVQFALFQPKAPQNSPVTQVSASLLAGGLSSADAL